MTTQSVAAAGLGAVFTVLFPLGIRLTEPGAEWPNATFLVGVAIFAAMGCLVGWVFEERDLKRAFYTGVGLPALIQVGTAEYRATLEDLTDQEGERSEAAATATLTHLGWLGAPAPYAASFLVPATGERIIALEVATGPVQGVRVQFVGGGRRSVPTIPSTKNDDVLEFIVPHWASEFRVVIGESHSRDEPLRGGHRRYRVDARQKPWSGLRQAIGIERAPSYEIEVQPSRRQQTESPDLLVGRPGPERGPTPDPALPLDASRGA